MKILMQSRVDLFDRRGGDTVQIEKTAAELRKLGVEVVVDCFARPGLANVDLVHLFNIDWPAQTFLQAKNAKKQNKPIVFSPIHHSYSEIERYEKEARFDLRRLINSIFKTRESREKFKDFCRMVVDPKKIPSVLTELRRGIMNEQLEILKMADLILVQTDAEAEDIEKDFVPLWPGKGQSLPSKDCPFESPFVKVVNGVDIDFAKAKPDWFVKEYGLKDFVLCVGRIEPRKNQLAVIKSVSDVVAKLASPYDSGRVNSATTNLVFVGKISWRHPEYALRFLSRVRKHDWIYHIPQISHEKMGSCYAAAKVHVLASWFETTGLVNLEAALAGAAVVSSSGRSQEYLGGFGFYCDPGDTNSVARAIHRAWERYPEQALKEHILKNFTWEIVGQQTLAAYHKVLNGSY